jgi:hypothetical protein
LSLSKLASAEDFEAAYLDGSLWFPSVSTVKVVRKPSVSALQPDDLHQQMSDFSCFIVEAKEQDLAQAPSMKSILMLTNLNDSMTSMDTVLPAMLCLVQESPHYGMAVKYARQEIPVELASFAIADSSSVNIARPCTLVLALVISESKSVLTRAGEGYKLVTENVRDMLGDADNRFTLTAYCTLGNVQNYKLDPPRSAKSQSALVYISSVQSSGGSDNTPGPSAFMVDSVELINLDEAEKLVPIMKKLLFATALSSQVTDHKRPWTEDANPAKASKCRALGRHPTGTELPEYSSTSSS